MIPKNQPLRDPNYIKWLHGERCIISGQYGNEHETVDPAHIRKAGIGMKSPDNHVLPILHHYHLEQDRMGEASMWRKYLPDDVLLSALEALAEKMYEEWKS